MEIYKITEKESQRIQILKLWFSIMVIFIHSYSEGVNLIGGDIVYDVPVWLYWIKYVISQVISRCAIPAFFFLSAILLYRKDFTWSDNIIKKIKTLFIPYVILNTFWICFYFMAQHIGAVSIYFSNPDNIIAEWNWTDYINAYLGFIPQNDALSYYPMLYPLWFIRDLMFLNIVALLLKRIIDMFPKIIFVFLVVLLLFNIQTHIFCLSQSSLVYFCFGYYFVKMDLHLSDIDKLNPMLTVCLYGVIIFLDCLTQNMSWHYLMRTISIIIGIIFFYQFTTNIADSGFKNKVLWLSGFSFPIYLFHEMSLTVTKKLLARLLPTGPVYQILMYFAIPVIIFIYCIILSNILNKCVPKFYYVLVGGRNK